MSNQPTLLDILSAISSQEPADGRSHSTSQDGPPTCQCGPDPAPANPSPSRVRGSAKATPVTCGPNGSALFDPADPASSLASRLAARLLSGGSMEYSLTWKARVTPAGRTIYQLRASGRRTSDSAFTGWRTPNAAEGGGAYQDPEKVAARVAAGHMLELQDQAVMAGWPTPNAGPQNDTDTRWEERREECKAKHSNGNGFGLTLGMASQMAGWPTPRVSDDNQSRMSQEAAQRERDRPNSGSNLAISVAVDVPTPLSGWATPQCCSPNSLRGQGQDPMERIAGGHQVNLQDQVRLAGETPAPSGAVTASGEGFRLNPIFVAWMQGYPLAHALVGMLLPKPSRKRASKP